MGRTKGKVRFGKLAFFLPILVVVLLIALIVFTFVGVAHQGTLVITAETSDRYGPSLQLHVKATVGAELVLTPSNLNLSGGVYTVEFPAIPGYSTPAAKTVTLANGHTAYAVGLYTPIVYVVQVTNQGFSTTSLSAIHKVNPIIWVNGMSSSVTLTIDSVGTVNLQPGSNYTHIFQSPGTFQFSFFGQNISGVVTVT